MRFATTLGFDLELATWRAVCDNAPSIHEVSAERIREELVKIFLSPGVSADLTCSMRAVCSAKSFPSWRR